MLNQLNLIGRRTDENKLKKGKKGVPYLQFNIAVPRPYKASGERKTDFFNILAFGQVAKYISDYLGKGKLVLVSGRIENLQYEKEDGQKVFTNQIIAEKVSILEYTPSEDFEEEYDFTEENWEE